MNKDDYRLSHTDEGHGEFYKKIYERGYYAALWREIEQPIIESVLRPMGGRDRTCLDFACGTGRITNVDAQFFGKVVGVDVSETMLAAARVPGNVCLRKIDLTVQSLEETFDVITAFRFFLHAKDRLRRETLKALHAHLNADGRLVCNIHMNATSPAGLASRIVNTIPGAQYRDTLSINCFRGLLMEEAFTVERVIPLGYLPRPGRLLPRLAEALVKPVERVALALRLPAAFAQDFVVIAKKQ
jgi:SAM-dependent methyltransferase